MSNTIREYKSITKNMYNPKNMILTAFVGSNEYRKCIQISIGSEHTVLSEQQSIDLIATIANRINCRKYYSATDTNCHDIVHPSGSEQHESI